jgi:hypothetical protein
MSFGGFGSGGGFGQQQQPSSGGFGFGSTANTGMYWSLLFITLLGLGIARLKMVRDINTFSKLTRVLVFFHRLRFNSLYRIRIYKHYQWRWPVWRWNIWRFW